MPRARPPTPTERPTTLRLNGEDLLTVQTTPRGLEEWALGFLFSEGIADGPAAIRGLLVQSSPPVVSVEASLSPGWKPQMARKRYLTSGCGKGVTFSSVRDVMTMARLTHRLQVYPERLAAWKAALEEGAELYRATGGVHAGALAHVDRDEVIVREDIGRHNAVDKAVGAALQRGWELRRCVLLTSGRISYEMCAKLARAGIALGASNTAVTDQAVRLAEQLDIALVGYLRPHRMVVYTNRAGHLVLPDYATATRG